MASLVNYLTRPLTPQEKKWIRDDMGELEYHKKKAEKYSNNKSIGGKLKFIHHTQEIKRHTKTFPILKNTKGPKANLLKSVVNRGAAALIRLNKCPDCHKEINIGHFKTEIQNKEYTISGKCVKCQLLICPG
jgi:hypothetical protein